MNLFDTMEDKHHKWVIYNIYNSAKFCGAEYNHDKKVPTHGITGKVTRSISQWIYKRGIEVKKGGDWFQGDSKDIIYGRVTKISQHYRSLCVWHKDFSIPQYGFRKVEVGTKR